MIDLQQQFGVAYLFISHDLAVVHHLCSEVAVMQAGRIVEHGPTDTVLRDPTHACTRALLDAVPRAPRDAPPLAGEGGRA
jgi:ABC-type dipeptide/oligopeptide/nickel transport system ATPase component